jgi:hypothetical protein
MAREVLDVCAPVRVRIAPACCLTGWTRDGWDCPGGPASAGSPWVSGGFFDLQEVPLGRSAPVWRARLRIAAGPAGEARPAGGRRRQGDGPGRQEVKLSPGRQEVKLSPAGRRVPSSRPSREKGLRVGVRGRASWGSTPRVGVRGRVSWGSTPRGGRPRTGKLGVNPQGWASEDGQVGGQPPGVGVRGRVSWGSTPSGGRPRTGSWCRCRPGTCRSPCMRCHRRTAYRSTLRSRCSRPSPVTVDGHVQRHLRMSLPEREQPLAGVLSDTASKRGRFSRRLGVLARYRTTLPSSMSSVQTREPSAPRSAYILPT